MEMGIATVGEVFKGLTKLLPGEEAGAITLPPTDRRALITTANASMVGSIVNSTTV